MLVTPPSMVCSLSPTRTSRAHLVPPSARCTAASLPSFPGRILAVGAHRNDAAQPQRSDAAVVAAGVAVVFVILLIALAPKLLSLIAEDDKQSGGGWVKGGADAVEEEMEGDGDTKKES